MWQQAIEKEAEWWGDCTNTADEEAKQLHYARMMGLEQYRVNGKGWQNAPFDLRGKSVLDIGGGPVSLLLKCWNHKGSVVADPLRWPDWVHGRYISAGIEYVQARGEDLNLGLMFDEVWLYNVLQHTEDPARVIENALRHGRVVRVWEWLGGEPDDIHLHVLTKEQLDTWLGANGTVHNINLSRYLPTAYSAVVETRQERQVAQQEQQGVFRFHLLGLAHVPTHPDVSTCAYTQKVVKLSRMLRNLGHTVYLYAGEGSQAECSELVTVVSDEDRRQTYGDYNWYVDFFKHDGKDYAYRTFANNASTAIQERQQDGDFLLCTMGNYQQSIADRTGKNMWVVESGIGYRGVFSKFRVFESYAWMAYVYGLLGQCDGSWYDAVIPNYFDPADFPYQPEKEDYALYIGRLVKRKGVDIARQVTEKLGIPLVIAGQGTLKNPTEGFDIKDKHVQFLGSVGPEVRKHLMGRAKMVFAPTYYIEPFGGVAVEAMMTGTPVITTDWGVFSETVLHGVTGYRCRTFDDFLWAARHIGNIDPLDCRQWAVANYSMRRVSTMYQEYFEKIADLRGDGWYTEHPEREGLDWLRRYYPNGVNVCNS